MTYIINQMVLSLLNEIKETENANPALVKLKNALQEYCNKNNLGNE